MIDRYNCEYCNIIGENGMCEAKDGEWVRYDDIKHLLERSDNNDYAVPPTDSPKPKKCHHIQPIQDYAKQLGHTSCPVCGGNFA